MKFFFETLRKLVHLFSLWIPYVYFTHSKQLILSICIPIAVFLIIFDYFNLYQLVSKYNTISFFDNLYRDHEKLKKRLSGSCFFIVGCCVSIIFFEKNVAILGMLILIFSDSFAALIGKQIPIYKIHALQKSIGGVIVFFATGLAVIYFTLDIFQLEFLNAIFALTVVTILEMTSKKINLDDNLLIPICFGICYNIF